MSKRVQSQFRADPRSVTQARAFVRSTLAAWGMGDVEEPAVLLTSELASNAVLHACSGFQVSLELRRPDVLVEVRDHSRAVPRRASITPQADSGRGLMLVEALACSWGTRLLRGGKAVWFVVTSNQRGSREIQQIKAKRRV